LSITRFYGIGPSSSSKFLFIFKMSAWVTVKFLNYNLNAYSFNLATSALSMRSLIYFFWKVSFLTLGLLELSDFYFSFMCLRTVLCSLVILEGNSFLVFRIYPMDNWAINLSMYFVKSALFSLQNYVAILEISIWNYKNVRPTSPSNIFI
jgi:hypothetical protein